MNIANEDLDALAALATQLRGAMERLQHRAAAAGDQALLLDLIQPGWLAAQLRTRLERAGAHAPAAAARVGCDPLPLSLMDTPANRRYLAALRAAWEAGQAVDRERYGADIGTHGEAQVIELVLHDKEAEVFGPAGMRE